MSAPQDLRAAGDRIEQLLDAMRGTTDPRTFDRVEEVLRLVTEIYGAGLARIVELTRADAPGLLDAIVADDLVASLLLVHDLHPASLASRVEDALARVRPLLASHGGDVQLLDIDPDAGAVRLRLLGSCDGCPSSSVTLQLAVESAIVEAAPEIVTIDVDQPAQPVPDIAVALSTKPVYEECPAEMAER
jgi:Fe-S cluster biogenesis protein NfuA